VEAHRQLLQLLVDRIAQARLDLRAGHQHEPPAQGDHDRLDDAESEHQEERGPDLGEVARAQRTVDERLQHLRNEQCDDAREQGGDHAEVDPWHGRLGVRVDAPERAERRRA
jgi:hypothetical protein